MSAKLGLSCKIVGSKRSFYPALSTSVVLLLILGQYTKPYITQTSADTGYRCTSSDICVFSPYFQSMSHSPKKSTKKKTHTKKEVISQVFSVFFDWLRTLARFLIKSWLAAGTSFPALSNGYHWITRTFFDCNSLTSQLHEVSFLNKTRWSAKSLTVNRKGFRTWPQFGSEGTGTLESPFS